MRDLLLMFEIVMKSVTIFKTSEKFERVRDLYLYNKFDL